jgi:hypothetical protein
MRRLFLALLLSLCLPGAVHAAAPEGTWVYDRAALEAQGDKFGALMAKRIKIDVDDTRAKAGQLEAQAKEIEEKEPDHAKLLRAQAAQMQQLVSNPAEFFKRRFIRGVAGERDNTLQLAPGGKAISLSEGVSEPGTWKIEGKEVVITFKDAAVRGTFGPKRLNLRYAKVPTADPETTSFLKGFNWVMIPK